MIPTADEMSFETSRLAIEPLQSCHAKAIYESMMDPRLYVFIPQDPPESLSWLEQKYKTWESRLSPDASELWLNWILRERSSTSFIGTLQATIRPDKSALLAYTVFPKYWQMGYATEACEALVSHLFAEYSLSKVFADVDSRNAASIRLLERLQFKRMEFTKNADHFKRRTSDEYRYQLLAPNCAN